MKKIQISPSILSADFSQLGNEIRRLEEGGADMIHVDVMDGHFVPNLTIGPPVIKALRQSCALKFDVHLMISPVHKYIEAYSDAGADFSQLGNEIKRLEEGGADMIHVDVMDGHFVPNLTIGPPVIKALRKQCSIKFDVHLMISPVHKYIEAYSDAGADIITIHPEATDNLGESILKIKSLNKKVGVSLNPKTKIDLIIDHLKKIDLILIMSVNPGFGGQKFMPEVLDKIRELKKIQSKNNLNFDIEIDGGINFDNCQSAIGAGANILVSGTTVFKSNNGDIKKNINLLKLK